MSLTKREMCPEIPSGYDEFDERAAQADADELAEYERVNGRASDNDTEDWKSL